MQMKWWCRLRLYFQVLVQCATALWFSEPSLPCLLHSGKRLVKRQRPTVCGIWTRLWKPSPACARFNSHSLFKYKIVQQCLSYFHVVQINTCFITASRKLSTVCRLGSYEDWSVRSLGKSDNISGSYLQFLCYFSRVSYACECFPTRSCWFDLILLLLSMRCSRDAGPADSFTVVRHRGNLPLGVSLRSLPLVTNSLGLCQGNKPMTGMSHY